MEDIRTRPLSAIDGPAWRRWLPQVMTLVFLIAGLGAFLAAPFLAIGWISTPFIGALVEPGLVSNGAGPAGSIQTADWSAYAQGFNQFGDQLLAVDERPVIDAAELQAALRAHQPGDTVRLTVRRLSGAVVTLPVTLGRFPAGDQIAFFFLPYLIGLVYLGAGVWVFAIRRAHRSGRAFALFAVSLALVIGLFFDGVSTHRLVWLWTIAVAMIGVAAVVLANGFTSRDRATGGLTPAAGLGMLLPGLAALYALLQQAGTGHSLANTQAWIIEFGVVAAVLGGVIGWLVIVRRRVMQPNHREQFRLLAVAALVSFGPVILSLIFQMVPGGPRFSPWLLGFLVIFPIMGGYTVQRYRMLQADEMLSLGIRYGLLSVCIAVGYALVAAGLGIGFRHFTDPTNPLITGFVFFVLAAALIPLRERTQRLVDSVFFRGKQAYQDRLQTFSGELTRVVDLPGILKTLRRYIDDSLAPGWLHIFIYDPLSDQYAAAVDETGQPSSDLRFPIISGLAIRLGEQHTPLMLNEFDALPPTLEPDRARLTLLGAQAFVPLPGRDRLAGWLALGPRPSGEPYTAMQLGFAEALCDQAALAIERAQVVAHMENRVREMNVLTRVAQGVNITLTLDDILELVYAQTVQIIPARHFRIMLYDAPGDVYQYAFYLDGDDRSAARESRPTPAGQALEQEVIRQRRPILTDDYDRECQQRGIMAPQAGLYAYMGVPLNAGAETIGALSLGSGDPAVDYTAEQQALLQAIADQVAGALVKARLLQETERRARQLATLNEVTRQLTSTLETEPLLQSILQSAVDILNCEAGSLLLFDEANDELVFRSVVGPVANTLVNSRMPADRGVVGKAIKIARPIIVNDVSRFPEWFSKNDETTGFVTRALLVIPLMVKDRVIGVIEVINKVDRTVFSADDQDLLTAFASQAAVAIENARLYTHTDQALSARVAELSVMQRIDRELNASLDPTTAMRITLEWAMRQSGANAGLVGVLQGEDTSGVKLMAWQGYSRELEPYQTEPLPAAEYQLTGAIREGLPMRRSADSLNHGDQNAFSPLLENGRSQAIIPIRRETVTIGLLLLESTGDTPLGEDAMNFLIRLSDHASIAISNAQLYAAVQQANLAKSDFVSFVAHELKNPMTSVKGYTELIAAGAVGPITEVQANFLGTIRANIERMNTLVSDLNDSSKIEVGRLRLDFKALRLGDSIETVVRSIRKQMEEKQQSLALDIPADLPPLWADRIRLEQVLVNLVSNAHKYTLAGGTVEIAAERCPNQWDPNGAAEVVHISVRDNGIGISEDDQKKIFQKFFRSEDPKTREVTGTGLGLNITRALVEMQGGKIWFESEFRKGTIFHFTVPVSET